MKKIILELAGKALDEGMVIILGGLKMEWISSFSYFGML